MDTTCEEFDNGSALHIAATNLSVEAAKALLGFGADVNLTDELVYCFAHAVLLVVAVVVVGIVLTVMVVVPFYCLYGY